MIFEKIRPGKNVTDNFSPLDGLLLALSRILERTTDGKNVTTIPRPPQWFTAVGERLCK